MDAVVTADGWLGISTVQLKTFTVGPSHIDGRTHLIIDTSRYPVIPPWDSLFIVWHTAGTPRYAALLSATELQALRGATVSVLAVLPPGWSVPPVEGHRRGERTGLASPTRSHRVHEFFEFTRRG